MWSKANSIPVDAIGMGDWKIDGSNDDCWPKAKNEKVDIVTSIYTS